MVGGEAKQVYFPFFEGSGGFLRVKNSLSHLGLVQRKTLAYFLTLILSMSSRSSLAPQEGQSKMVLSTFIVPPYKRNVVVETTSDLTKRSLRMKVNLSFAILSLHFLILLVWQNHLATLVTINNFLVSQVSHHDLLSFQIFQHLSSLSFNTWK